MRATKTAGARMRRVLLVRTSFPVGQKSWFDCLVLLLAALVGPSQELSGRIPTSDPSFLPIFHLTDDCASTSIFVDLKFPSWLWHLQHATRRSSRFRPDTRQVLLVVLTHVPFIAPTGLLGPLFPSVIHLKWSSLHESTVARCRL